MSAHNLCIHVVGRLSGVTWRRLADAVAKADGRLVRRPSGKVNVVVLSHGSAASCLADPPSLMLPDGVPDGAARISEFVFKRRLGLAGPLPADSRTFAAVEFGRAAGLDASVVEILTLYDVLTPEGGRFGFSDLRVARETARLLAEGLSLADIVEAHHRLKAAGSSLAGGRLLELPGKRLGQRIGNAVLELGGQYALPLDESCVSADEAFERAEGFEAMGDLASAERWYRLAARIDRHDPVIPFNLGNVLEAQGRIKEAALAFRDALARDLGFAEAWLNLAVMADAGGKVEEAEELYWRALMARPDDADAVYSYALFLTRHGRFSDACPRWKRYLSLSPPDDDARQVRRMLRLCEDQAAVAAFAPSPDGRCRHSYDKSIGATCRRQR